MIKFWSYNRELKKYKKNLKFEDNKVPTFLIADVSKMKKLCKYRLSKKIETQIF